MKLPPALADFLRGAWGLVEGFCVLGSIMIAAFVLLEFLMVEGKSTIPLFAVAVRAWIVRQKPRTST